jgi:hypothetical protein
MGLASIFVTKQQIHVIVGAVPDDEGFTAQIYSPFLLDCRLIGSRQPHQLASGSARDSALNAVVAAV